MDILQTKPQVSRHDAELRSIWHEQEWQGFLEVHSLEEQTMLTLPEIIEKTKTSHLLLIGIILCFVGGGC